MQLKKRILSIIFLICIFIVCILVLFHTYILGNKYFLFYHVVNDVVVQFYPVYFKAATLIKQGISLPTFTFSNGWGDNIGINGLFERIIISLGTDQIPYMIGIVEILKVFGCGIVAYIYNKILNLKQYTCIIGALAVAFSEQVLIGGMWKFQAELVIGVFCGFIFVESILKKKKSCGMISAIVTCFVFYNELSVYYWLVYGVFLCLYFAIRYWMIADISHKKMDLKRKIFVLTILGILGIIVCFAVYGQMTQIIHSYRFQLGFSQWKGEWLNTFSKQNIKQCITAFLRTLSPTIMGIGGLEGYSNEGPAAYCEVAGYNCGILLVLMIPQAFIKAGRKKRILYIGMLIAFGILVGVPAVRLFLNGFANSYFKLTRLLGTFVIYYIGINGLNSILKDKSNLNLKLLWLMIFAIIAVMLVLILTKYHGKIYIKDMFLIWAFLGCYGVFLTGYFWIPEAEYHFRMWILVMFAIEVVAINYRYINNSDAMTSKEWETSYYNDGTVEAVKSIKDNSFYRVEKDYRSGLLDDAQVQGYNGTTYYVGGVANQDRTDMLISLGIPTLWNQRGYCAGMRGNTSVSTLFGTKYFLTKFNSPITYGYENVDKIDDVSIFINTNNLPLAFAYDDVISQSDFEAFEYEDRDEVILQKAVVENDSCLLKYRNKEPVDLTRIDTIDSCIIDNYVLGEGILFQPVDENEVLVVKVENSSEACVEAVWCKKNELWQYGKSTVLSVYAENQKGILELNNQSGTTMLTLQPLSTSPVEKVQRISLFTYDSEEYYRVYNESIAHLQNQALNIETYSDTYIKGNIDINDDKLLYISIPYGSGWTYKVDGKEVEAYKVNYAFTGIWLKKGTHTIEMYYK